MLIGELADRTGVSRRSLRYYEEQSLLVPERSSKGYRIYEPDAALVVAQIQGLYASGLDSGEIRRFLPCARGVDPELIKCADLRRTLEQRHLEVVQQAADLAEQKERLEQLIGAPPRRPEADLAHQ